MIYENIKKYARLKDTNIAEIERRLGFPRGSISKWDKNVPGVNKTVLVANLLDCTVEDLVEGEEYEARPDGS